MSKTTIPMNGSSMFSISENDTISILETLASKLGHPNLQIISSQSSTVKHKDTTKRLTKVSESDKKRIVKMFQKGKTTSEVMEKFSYSKMQLAAIKAWVTMGKY